MPYNNTMKRTNTSSIRHVSLTVLLLLSASAHAFVPSSNTLHRTRRTILDRPQTNDPFSTTTTTSTTTSLSATPVAQVGLGALAGCVTGGLFAGGLHAIAGPDHLAALLPRCCGQAWYRAGSVGALWGMGHGVSATLLGLTAFALKTTLNSKWLRATSHVTELAVGLSLIVIGVLGWKEAQEEPEMTLQSLSAAAAPVAAVKRRAVVFNGLLHGFSWDGAPGLAPAVAVATWSGSLAFLLSYAAGTIVCMATVTMLIGEATRQASRLRPDLPQQLAKISSVVAMGIGAVWCGLAVV